MIDGLQARSRAFAHDLPYRQPPYASRSWGHPLHSLCSYQGKLKPAMAHFLVREFVPEGGTVLDPLGGVGTIPLEAALQGHSATSNDKSPFAALVASAKLNPPSLAAAETSLNELSLQMAEVELTDQDWAAASFGLNSSVTDYYHPDTLAEVLRARRVLAVTGWGDQSRRFVWASLLHVLHGNRPYALSRTSHPITPFAPKGEAYYKSVIAAVRARMSRSLSVPLPADFAPGLGLHGDFRALPGQIEPVDSIITSPPFVGMRFDRPNWLRLWFCGWGADEFNTTSLGFLERQQTTSALCYSEFFADCRTLLKDDGLMVVHIGSGGRRDFVSELKVEASDAFALVNEIVEDVRDAESHGIKDKGLTTAHHLLFLQPR